jgi:biopolymer transport protein ExbD
MITRPLDLASKLRPEPRNFDALFFVNVGLIVLFFSLFGSRFVLAPGVTMLPKITGTNAGARTTTHYITVLGERQIIAGDGLRDLEGLKAWLAQEASAMRKDQKPVLLVQSNAGRVDVDLLAQIVDVAWQAGFITQWASVEPDKKSAPARP